MFIPALLWMILCQGSDSLLCVFAGRINWETPQLTIERYVSEPLFTDIPENHA